MHQPKTLLVTGGAGFIGSNFVHYVLRAAPEVFVVNVDLLTYAGTRENLTGLPDPARHVFVEADICDTARMADLLRQHNVDTVVHFAAESHVDRSILGPMTFVQTNIVGTASLLEAARAVWLAPEADRSVARRFHHVSTDEVYGTLEPDDPAFSETTPYAPSSPYSASKAASDHLVRAYAHTYRLPVTLTNCSNNYGPRQFPEKLIPLMTFNAMMGRPLPIYGDGQQVRDWLHVDDHCDAIWTVIRRGADGETYNVGGDNQMTNLALVEMICDILDERFPDSPHVPHASLKKFVTDRPGHDRRYAMDISKIGRELGWRPSYDLHTGLFETLDWYLNNSEWLAAIDKQNTYQNWLALQYAQR